jgi:hypothetical protein
MKKRMKMMHMHGPNYHVLSIEELVENMYNTMENFCMDSILHNIFTAYRES